MNVEKLKAKLRHWRDSPPAFVRECLGAQPDPWQDDVLEHFNETPRIAVKASKGPGKSALAAWLILLFLCTRRHPKVACTSITGDNLRDNLWAEVAKWRGHSEFLKSEFDWSAERVWYKRFPETWWAVARAWPRSADPSKQADTLAGLHAEHVLYVLDEAGGIPDAVMAAAEGALSTGGDVHLFIDGNPTHLSGPLYRACTTERALWHVVEIEGLNLKRLRQAFYAALQGQLPTHQYPRELEFRARWEGEHT